MNTRTTLTLDRAVVNRSHATPPVRPNRSWRGALALAVLVGGSVAVYAVALQALRGVLGGAV